MNLEHLRLLNVRGARIERGSGGQPEITWDDVAMMMLSMSRTASAYARYRYAGDLSEWHAIRRGMIATIYVSDEWDNNPSEEYWETLIALGLKAFCSGHDLSQKQKAKAVGIKWWKAEFERDYRTVIQLLDEYDHDLRDAIRMWNTRLHDEEVAG